MSVPTTPRTEDAAADFTLNATRDRKMTIAQKVVNPERSLVNSSLLVFAVTLAMVINVRNFFGSAAIFFPCD